ncbi:MAG: DUF393 domain-containing protein [Chloroflexi bacterium]|nr:DUF393 domain-containing protein [Chloroflexota bacterium]
MTTVLYDGNCALCRQSRRLIAALDWCERIEFLDIHDWAATQARYPALDFETAMGQMHADPGDGRLLGGFEGARRLLHDLPLVWPLWLIFHLPGMNRLGEQVYRFVARRRYQINRLLGAQTCAQTCHTPER